MLKQRLIPTLLLREQRMVKGVKFDNYRDTGDPISTARIYNAQYVDELVIVDIDATNEGRSFRKEVIEIIAKECFMPLTIGGGINSLETIRDIVLLGADKVLINSAAYNNEELIRQGSEMFGKQCIVVGIDVKKEDDGYVVYRNSGRVKCEVDLFEHIANMEILGAGELFVNNISKDGMMDGYDIDLINAVCNHTNLPVVACGGAGNFSHLAEGYTKTKVSGLAMASIFHFGDNNPIRARAYLKNNGVDIKEI
jgi:cyclase